MQSAEYKKKHRPTKQCNLNYYLCFLLHCQGGGLYFMQRQRQNSKPWIKKIDFVFYNERPIREAVLDERNGLRPDYNVRTSSGLSDPTARDAIRNLTPITSIIISGQPLKFPERWIIVIDKTYLWCSKQSSTHYEVARRRYNGEDYRVTCRELNISNTTRRNTLEHVRMYAALQAVQLKLITVE